MSISYVTAICAGNSLFIWSTTAGLILSDKVTRTGIEVEAGQKVVWDAGQYFKYRIFNYLVQISIVLMTATLDLSV